MAGLKQGTGSCLHSIRILSWPHFRSLTQIRSLDWSRNRILFHFQTHYFQCLDFHRSLQVFRLRWSLQSSWIDRD